jgi:hypothetical protein
VWTTSGLCGLSASSSEPATNPGAGWHVTAEITGFDRDSGRGGTADQMTVNLSWQRKWENGRAVNGTSGSREITLRAGERVELDQIVPNMPSTCGASQVRLEASVTSQPAYRLSNFSGFRGQMPAAGAAMAARGSTDVAGMAATATAGARGGRGAGRGAATTSSSNTTGTVTSSTGATSNTTGTTAGTTTVMRGGRGVGASAGGMTTVDPATGAYTLRGGRVAGADTTANAAALRGNLGQRQVYRGAAGYDADLWLVHRKPDGTEAVQQQTVHFGAANTAFAFPPIQVQTSKGLITIDISGKLQSFVGDEALGRRPLMTQTTNESASAQHISISIDRRAHAAGPPLLDITGGSSMVIDVPSASDVLSFEFPALQKSAEDLLKGHLFSLRVKIAGK